MPKGGGRAMKMKVPGGMPGMPAGSPALQAALKKQMEASQAAEKKAEENKAAATGSTEQSAPVTASANQQPQMQIKTKDGKTIDPKDLPPHVLRQIQMQHAARNR